MKSKSLILLTLLFFVFISCEKEEKNLKDSLGNKVVLEKEYKRVISLSPTISELIYELGAENLLVGRTKYCDYPKEIEKIRSVGDMITPSIESIIDLNCDLVIASDHFTEESYNRLKNLGIEVAVFINGENFEDYYKNLNSLGSLLDREEKATEIIVKMKEELKKIEVEGEKPTLYYAIDFGDYGNFTAGGDTYISEIIDIAGGENIAKNSNGWVYSLESIIFNDPDIIVCSSKNNTMERLINYEPFRELKAVKNHNVYEIDRDNLDRQSYRNLIAIEEFRRIILEYGASAPLSNHDI